MKEQYLENALNYAEAFKAIFEDKVEGKEYRRSSRKEKAGGKKCHEIFEVLREANRLAEIEEYMYNENPYVRYITSAYCLFSNPEIAEKTLEELIKTDDHEIQSHAWATLKGWRDRS